jgi:hypothetical protein
MNQTAKFPLMDTILRIVVLFVLIVWCIGLFSGAIVLSVGYTLMVHWIGEGQN